MNEQPLPAVLLFTIAAFVVTRGILPKALTIAVNAGFTRPNFRGQPVVASAGVILGLVYSALLLLWHALWPSGLSLLVSLVVVAMALIGFVDDVWGDARAKGLRGHAGLLLRGGLSTGGMKAVFGGVVSLAVARAAADDLYTALVGAVVVALAANAVNLLDVRPGRALKGAVLLYGALLAASWPAPVWAYVAPLWGVLAAYASYDLRSKAMLGDSGANWLGAVAGVAAVEGLEVRGLLVTGVALALLHVISETGSVTRVIERVPVLRRLDEWGRE